MYIKTGGKTYPCRDYRAGEESVRFILDGAVPEELGETVQLCGEDGFVMAEQHLADWLRWEMQGGALVLTNTPVPEPVPEPDPLPGPGPDPEPVEPQLSTEASMAQAIIDLQYEVDQMKLNGGNAV